MARDTTPASGAASTYGSPPTGVGVSSYSWGDSSGPWLTVTQNGFFTYARVPKGTLATQGLTLSSAQPTYNFQGTELLVIWQAQVDSVKSTDNFATSSFQQTQKWGVNSVSSDYQGTVYGEAADYTPSTYGPRGTGNTTQKFIKRVLWDDNLHSTTNDVFAENVLGTNFVMASGAGWQGVDTSSMQTEFYTDFARRFLPAHRAGTLLEEGMIYTVPLGNGLYDMLGTYDPDNESFAEFIATIDECGTRTKMFQWASIPPTTGVCGGGTSYFPAAPIGSGFCYNYQVMGFNDGCSHYDVNRHDYS